MKKYYIAYVYRGFNGTIQFGSQVFELDLITFDNLKESMDEIKDRILHIHPADKIVINSWQEL